MKIKLSENNMDKLAILDIMRRTIVDVAPFAEDLLENSGDLKNLRVCFVDLGINSINYAEIMLIVMDKLNLDFSLEIFTRTNNISDAVDIVYGLKSRTI